MKACDCFFGSPQRGGLSFEIFSLLLGSIPAACWYLLHGEVSSKHVIAFSVRRSAAA